MVSAECLTDSECTAKLAPGVCEMARCEAGTCVKENRAANTTCSDDALTLGACQVGRCDGAGACAAAAAADGQPCGASDACNRQICQGGSCVADEPTMCWDGNDCTDDICDPKIGCTFVNNTAECDDGNPCTSADACKEGFCEGGPNECECFEDADCAPMDTDLCDGPMVCEANKCVNDNSKAVVCDEPPGLSVCEKVSCVPATGQCVVSVDEFAPCDDGNSCTQGDFCAANGNCVKGNQVTCEFNCGDQVDEDGDSVTDCEDEDCASTPACQG